MLSEDPPGKLFRPIDENWMSYIGSSSVHARCERFRFTMQMRWLVFGTPFLFLR
jgi:hypothetical protein